MILLLILCLWSKSPWIRVLRKCNLLVIFPATIRDWWWWVISHKICLIIRWVELHLNFGKHNTKENWNYSYQRWEFLSEAKLQTPWFQFKTKSKNKENTWSRLLTHLIIIDLNQSPATAPKTWWCFCGKMNFQHTNPTGKCTGSHQVIITHKSEVDPTGIDGSSNISKVISLVKLTFSELCEIVANRK